MLHYGISKPLLDGSAAVAVGSTGRTLVQAVVAQRYGDQNRGERAEAENGHSEKVQEVALRINPAHRQIEGDAWLTTAAFSLAIPVLLTICFLGVYMRETAITKRDRRHSIAVYLLGLAGALLAIHAAVH